MSSPKQKQPKQQKPKPKKAPTRQLTSPYVGGVSTFGNKNRSFSQIRSSPWRNITFTVQIDAPSGAWGQLNSDAVYGALTTHLGFVPSSTRYLEVRYVSIAVRGSEPGSALALRIFRIPTSGDEQPNTTMSVESYASSAVAYPICKLSFDKVSKLTPVTGGENVRVASIYPHLTKSETMVVAKITLLYRHAETPFENEKFTFPTISLTTDP